MRKNWIAQLFLITYTIFLVKLLVFKDLPVIRFGGMMFNLGGPQTTGEANYQPFKTIESYLGSGFIGGINIIGNIVLLIPFGFIVPFIFKNMTWRSTISLALLAPLAIEVTQVLLRVGIFDIDDVILNGLGILLGYAFFRFFIARK